VKKEIEDNEDCPECPKKQKKLEEQRMMEEQNKIKAKPASRLSLRDRILNVNDRREELVRVPWWGDGGDEVEILMKSLTAGDWAELQQSVQLQFKDGAPSGVIRQWSNIEIVIYCAFDPETGSKLFTRADHDMLASKHPGTIDFLGSVSDRLSGLSADEVKQARANFRKTRG
jgi:hypothetical protein